jgi:4-hydroxy-tetrahydrodipicolinate reductase
MKKSVTEKKTVGRKGVAVSGGGGRMGRLLVAVLHEHPIFTLSLLLPRANQIERVTNQDTRDVELVVDFSVPENTLAVALMCVERGIPLFVGTTGFTPTQLKNLENTINGKIPWAMVPNTSLGVFLMKKTIQMWAPYLGVDYQVYLEEAHHIHKKDHPSGTAKMLAAEAVENGLKLSDTLVMRGGSEVGDHRLIALGTGERLELQHRAVDRSLFASGALRLAQKLIKQKPRRKSYQIDELFE